MDDKKRNRQTSPDNEAQNNDAANQEGSQQNVSNEEDQNPQDGGSWNNYRTREMGSGESDENFYRNRERGNYEEGQRSDEGGGGSLY